MSYLLELMSEFPVYDFIIDKYYRTQQSNTTYFGDSYKLKIFEGFQFTGFFKPNIDELRTPTKLKLHYAIDHRDLETALEIIGPICNKYNIPGFKIINYPFYFDINRPEREPTEHHQDGKDFTIYIGEGQDTPEFMNQFTQEIEQALIQNGIRPAEKIGSNLLSGDKPIQDSIFGYYRYEAYGYSFRFGIPEDGDIMENVSAKPTSPHTDLQVIECHSLEELKENKELLKALDIPYNIKENADYQNLNQAKYHLYYHNNPESDQIINALHQKSLDNMFMYQTQNPILIQQIQNTLNKLNWDSIVLLDCSKPDKKTESLFIPHKNVLQHLMNEANIPDLSQLNVFPVISRDESIRVQMLLKEQNIPVVRFSYPTENNTNQYCLVFNGDSHTRTALLKTRPAFANPESKKISIRNTYIKKMSHQNS